MRLLWILVTLAGIGYTKALKEKDLNFELETVLEFVNADRKKDIRFIENIKNFLDQLEYALQGPSRRAGPKTRQRNRRRFSSATMDFIEFVENTLVILTSYSDDDLEDLLAVVASQIRRYRQDHRMNELFEEEKIKSYVNLCLNEIEDTTIKNMRKKLDDLYEHIQELKREESSFLGFLNELHRHVGSHKMINVLENLKTYKAKSKRSVADLSKIVQYGFKNIFYDHYMNMDPELRRDFQIRFESYWQDYNNPNKKRDFKILDLVSKRTTPQTTTQMIKKHVIEPEDYEYRNEFIPKTPTTETVQILKKHPIEPEEYIFQNEFMTESPTTETMQIPKRHPFESEDYKIQSDREKSSSYESGKVSTEDVTQKDTIVPTKPSMNDKHTEKGMHISKDPSDLIKEPPNTSKKHRIKPIKPPDDSFLKSLWEELKNESPSEGTSPKKHKQAKPKSISENFGNEIKPIKKSSKKRIERYKQTKRFASLIQEEIVLTEKPKRKRSKYLKRPKQKEDIITLKETSLKKLNKKKLERYKQTKRYATLIEEEIVLTADPEPEIIHLTRSEEHTKTTKPMKEARPIRHKVKKHKEKPNRIYPTSPVLYGHLGVRKPKIRKLKHKIRFINQENTNLETQPKHEIVSQIVKNKIKHRPKTTETYIVDYEDSELNRRRSRNRMTPKNSNQAGALRHPDSGDGLTIEDVIEQPRFRNGNPWQSPKALESANKVVKRIGLLEKELALVKSKILTITQKDQKLNVTVVAPVTLKWTTGLSKLNYTSTTVPNVGAYYAVPQKN